MSEYESQSSPGELKSSLSLTPVQTSTTSTEKLRRILIMAGGTGGHIFPGLAFAEYCKEQGVIVEWLGSRHGLETTMVPAAGYKLHSIEIRGIRGKGWLTMLFAPLRILTAMLAAYRAIKTINPDAVIGMGGFVSGPGGVVARLLGKPLIIHEQNAKAGITNYLLTYFAHQVLQAFPDSFPRTVHVHTVGNPVRAEIETVAELNLPDLIARQRLRILVLGGSLGAQALNQILPAVLAIFDSKHRPEVWHQTGEKHFATTNAAYHAHNLKARVVPFITEMADAYVWADLVICRAGALTIAELCAAGRGGVLIPYPHAVDDHQTLNASFMVKHQAGYCISQADLQVEDLAKLLNDLQLHPEKCQALARRARDLHRGQVSACIFNYCKESCH